MDARWGVPAVRRADLDVRAGRPAPQAERLEAVVSVHLRVSLGQIWPRREGVTVLAAIPVIKSEYLPKGTIMMIPWTEPRMSESRAEFEERLGRSSVVITNLSDEELKEKLECPSTSFPA